MTKYDLVVILDGRRPDEEKEQIAAQVTDAVEKSGGKVINSEAWLKKQKMTFLIKGCAEGTYYLTCFEGGGDTERKIRQSLRIHERLLRFAIFKS